MVLKIALLAAIAAIAALSLKQSNESASILILIAASVIIGAFVLANMLNAIGEMREIFSYTGVDGTYFKIIVKCLGISLVAELAADICEDAAYKSLSSQIILGAKIAIIALALPLFKAVLELSIGMIQS